MSYSFDQWPEEPETQASGRRAGGPPGNRTAVDLLDQPGSLRPRRAFVFPLKKVAAIVALSILLVGIALLLAKAH
jgi:hypothetical protein